MMLGSHKLIATAALRPLSGVHGDDLDEASDTEVSFRARRRING